MSIEHLDRIDAISINCKDRVILSISDHLDWDNEQLHSTMLQDKIFAYLEFMESGQMLEIYPDSKDKLQGIMVHLKFAPTEFGSDVLQNIKDFFDSKSLEFGWEIVE